ncbi:MAG: zf-HC2 domain-containing protein, partial [Myxococcales bacterium]
MTGAGTVPDAEESCPGVTTIVAFLDGDLGPRERVQLEAHLAGCEDCRQLVSALAPAPDTASGGSSGAGAS